MTNYKDYERPRVVTRIKESFVIPRKEELKTQRTHVVQEMKKKGISKIRFDNLNKEC